MKAWHFLPADRELTNGDGRRVIAGRWLGVEGPPVPRLHGLHACVDIMDALNFAWEPVLQRVEMGGEIVRSGKLIAATRRKCLWWIDATQVLRRYARLCELDTIHRWNAPDIVVRYLCTGDESLRNAAWEAAYTRQRRRLLRLVHAEHRRQEADR